MTTSILAVKELSRSFGHGPAVDRISLAIGRGQIVCLLGPSGCGKTTLLRLIAGLETPDAGSVWFDGQDITAVPPHKRDFGLMFQDFALFPHKNVGQNVAFGLQMKTRVDVEARVGEMLALVGLAGFGDRDISSLSGGERQRVALARSLAPSPRLLMLDEPLGALDRALRERLLLEIRQILKAVGLTALYVTHDQTEAFAVADRVVVMNNGQIEQDSPPERLFARPQTEFTARFLGFSNLLPGTVTDMGLVETSLGRWDLPAAANCASGATVKVLIRPEAARLKPVNGAPAVRGKLAESLFRGRFCRATYVTDSGETLVFEMPPAELPGLNQPVTIWLQPASILLLPG